MSGLGAGRAFDPLARAELQASLDRRIAALRDTTMDALRGQLEARVAKLWLLQRAEMLLWWIHAAVLRQRRAVVCLPDVSLARAVAGPDATRWPKNWRQNLYAALQSLAYLHAAAWTIDTSAWKPPLGWESACISFVKDLRGTAADRCTEDCALWQAAHPAPHGHFQIGIGPGLLGVLNCYRTTDGQTFDFVNAPAGQAGKMLKAARYAGRICRACLPAKLFVSSQTTLTPRALFVLQALVRELTRTRRKATRPDQAEVFEGERVPDSRTKGGYLPCPVLAPSGSYVCFGGNGDRPGWSYRIRGSSRRGWLARCGYRVPRDRSTLVRTFIEFLEELDGLAQPLGLLVAGLDAANGTWHGLGTMLQMARACEATKYFTAEQSGFWKTLDRLLLRVYTESDYLERWRVIFVGEPPPAIASLVTAEPPLRQRLKEASLTQKQLSAHLGVAQSFISQLLNGARPWPSGMKEQAEAWLQGYDGQGQPES